MSIVNHDQLDTVQNAERARPSLERGSTASFIGGPRDGEMLATPYAGSALIEFPVPQPIDWRPTLTPRVVRSERCIYELIGRGPVSGVHYYEHRPS